MKLRQGPQLHKACSVRGAVLHTGVVAAGRGRGAPPGSLSAGGNKLGSVPISAESPPTSRHDDMYINPGAHLMTHMVLGPICQHVELTGNVTVRKSYHTSCHTSATATYKPCFCK